MANGAVSALMHKVACESLGIKNSAILDEELKKKESLVDAFVSGVGPKKIGTPATPQLAWPRGPGSVVVWLSRAARSWHGREATVKVIRPPETERSCRPFLRLCARTQSSTTSRV
jgi:hypothetical protein